MTSMGWSKLQIRRNLHISDPQSKELSEWIFDKKSQNLNSFFTRWNLRQRKSIKPIPRNLFTKRWAQSAWNSPFRIKKQVSAAEVLPLDLSRAETPPLQSEETWTSSTSVSSGARPDPQSTMNQTPSQSTNQILTGSAWLRNRSNPERLWTSRRSCFWSRNSILRTSQTPRNQIQWESSDRTSSWCQPLLRQRQGRSR